MFYIAEADEITKQVGDELMSGKFLVSGEVKVQLEKVGKDSYIAKLLQLKDLASPVYFLYFAKAKRSLCRAIKSMVPNIMSMSVMSVATRMIEMKMRF